MISLFLGVPRLRTGRGLWLLLSWYAALYDLGTTAVTAGEVHQANEGFVLLDHSFDLGNVLHRQLLQFIGIECLLIHDHQTLVSVDVDLQLIGDNHFGGEFGHVWLWHLEQLRQADNSEGLILTGSSEKEGFQCTLLENSGEHRVKRFDLHLWLSLEEADVHDVVYS